MIIATLKRNPSTNQGTYGVLSCADFGFSCFTLELPWKNNQAVMSCIPAGEYDCVIRKSPKFGTVFILTNVDGRQYILLHNGSWAGDTDLGFRTHSHGCILLGKSKGYLEGQRATLNSRLALKEFMRVMNNQPFKLIISWL